MRTLMIVMLAVAMIASPAFAQSEMGQEQGERRGQETATGTVQEMNQEQMMLTLQKEDGTTEQYEVTDDAEVTGPDGAQMSLSDVSAGSQVEVRFTGQQDQKRVSQIQIQQEGGMME